MYTLYKRPLDPPSSPKEKASSSISLFVFLLPIPAPTPPLHPSLPLLLHIKFTVWVVGLSILLIHAHQDLNEGINLTLPSSGNAAFFSCTPSLSEPLCPGAIATCTCVVDGNNSFTRFNFTNLNMKNGCNDSIIDLTQPTLCDNYLSGTCGRYLSAAVVGGNDCTHTSVLTITPNSTLDGLGISCEDMSSRQIIGNALLRVTGWYVCQ